MSLHLALVTTACYSLLATYLTPSKVCGRYEKTCDFCELEESSWWLVGLGSVTWQWSLDKPLLQSNTTAPRTLSCSGSLLFNSEIVCAVKVAVWFLTPSDSLCVQSCIHGAAGVEVACLLLHDWSCRFGLSTGLPLWLTPSHKSSFKLQLSISPRDRLCCGQSEIIIFLNKKQFFIIMFCRP